MLSDSTHRRSLTELKAIETGSRCWGGGCGRVGESVMGTKFQFPGDEKVLGMGGGDGYGKCECAWCCRHVRNMG